jgi:hypothetical protein
MGRPVRVGLLAGLLGSVRAFLSLHCRDGTAPSVIDSVHLGRGHGNNTLTKEVDVWGTTANIWHGKNNVVGHIVYDLGCVQGIKGFMLQSSVHSGTKDFGIHSSPHPTGPWTLVLASSLPDARMLSSTPSKVDITTFPVDGGGEGVNGGASRIASRYIKFEPTSSWDDKFATLQYFAVINAGSMTCPSLNTEITGTQLAFETAVNWEECSDKCAREPTCQAWWMVAAYTKDCQTCHNCKLFSLFRSAIPGDLGQGGTAGDRACRATAGRSLRHYCIHIHM